MERLAAIDFDVVRCSEIEAVQRTLPSWCTILVESRLDRATEGRISSLARLTPHTPILIVVSRRDVACRCPGLTRTNRLVWSTDIERLLLSTVRRARIESVKTAACVAVSLTQHLGPTVRRAALTALRVSQPVRTVSELAMVVGRHRTTLSRDWNISQHRGIHRLEDFVDWILLVDALGTKRDGQPWSDVATGLRVHERSLNRTARRLLGMGLRDASRNLPAVLGDDAVQRILGVLLGRQTES